MTTGWRIAAILLAAVLAASLRTPAAAADPAFSRWLDGLRPQALALGVTRATFDAATATLAPDLSLPDLILPGRSEAPRGQAEFVQTPAQYLDEKRLATLAARGRALLAQHRGTLDAIAARFGVPPEVLLAIWGRETAFGTHVLRHDALRVLATQAYLGRRKEQFRDEFLLALKLLQEERLRPADMRSSWAGALGQTQFLPSEFFKYAVDFDGDGRRDIWTSIPDTLASAAAQLAGKGWQRGQGWATEVRVPNGTDCTIADPGAPRPLTEWLSRGFTPVGSRMPSPADRLSPASLLMPAGSYGPAFLILPNYHVIKAYNFSDLYVLFVGNLADRIGGAEGFAAPWRPVVQMGSADLESLQRTLAARGLYADTIDGKAGMRTRLAVGMFQKQAGLPQDCWPNDGMLRSAGTR